MRTEVKIGVAIGLVVALVVVGYLVYQSHHNPNQTVAQGEYNRTFGDKTPAPVPAKPPEVSPALAGGATTAPSPTSGVPHLGTGSLPTIGSGTALSGTTGTGLRVSPLTPGLRTSESATPTPAASLDRTYTVVSGDTLSSIAQKEYGEASKYTLIVAANPGLDASHLRLNQKIKIPAAPAPSLAASTTDMSDWNHSSTTQPAGDAASAAGGTYVVQDGDAGLWIVAKKVYGDARLWTAIEKSNRGVSTAAIRKGQHLICPPLDEARRLSGISGTATTRPAGLASTDSFGSETGTRLSSPGRTLAHVGTSTTTHAAVPADDGKPRFPVRE